MELHTLKPGEVPEFIALLEIFQEVFENEEVLPNSAHLEKLLSPPLFKVFVVKKDGVVIGGLTLHVLPGYYPANPTAYIYDVGVSGDFQRQGVGKFLMAETCTSCKENGFDQAFVEAERQDTDAIAFYRKTPVSSEMKAIQFTYNFDD